MALAGWSATKVAFVCVLWLVVAGAGLWFLSRLTVHSYAARGAADGEWTTVAIGGWWMGVLWLLPPLALIATWLRSARAR